MKRITILLAEDHMIVREGFRKMLELEADLEVVGEAQEGRQAVVLAKKLHPDVVLMDIAMPQLNGLEATRQIRKDGRWKALPIVAMTAHAMTGDKERCLEAGMTGYISKPVHAAHLIATVEEILGKKSLAG